MKKVFVNRLIKNIVLFLLAVAAVVGTFYLENMSVVQTEVLGAGAVSFENDQEVAFPNYGMLRFDQNYENFYQETYDETNDAYLIGLEQAHLWANYEVSDDKVNFLIDGMILTPSNAVFDLNFDGERLELTVYGGDVYIGFLLGSPMPEAFVDENYQFFKKRIVVPQDTKAVIPLSKLDERVEQLLYSKLVKEFRFSSIPSSESESEWVSANRLEDEKYLELLRQQFQSEVSNRGRQLSNDFLDRSKFFLRENLTFVPSKEIEVVTERLFATLEDAVYLLEEGEESEAVISINDFKAYAAAVPPELKEAVNYDQKIDAYLRDLLLFSLNSRFEPLIEEILMQQFQDPAIRFEILEVYWQNIYMSLTGDSLILEGVITKYMDLLNTALESVEDLDFKRLYLSERNQLFDNLFLRYPALYMDKFFAQKSVLEERLLALYNEGQLKRELEQSLVDNKIDFLRRLQNFFFDGEVEVDEAREILTRLVEESQFYLEKRESQTAIVEIFETRLDDLANFGGYLSDPEYYSSSIHGSTHKERYETYLRDSERIWSFIDLQKELLGEADVEEETTIEDVNADLEEIFASYESVTNFNFEELTDITQRYVEVSGVIGGYPFRATYDRANDSLREVYVYEELVSERPVKIASLLPLLDRRYAEVVQSEEESEVTEESNARRIARIFIQNQIEELGFVVPLEDVSVVDEAGALYRIENIYLEDYPGIVFTFDYQTVNETATNLLLSIDEEVVSLQGDFSLQDLERIALAEGDFTVVLDEEIDEEIEGEPEEENGRVLR